MAEKKRCAESVILKSEEIAGTKVENNDFKEYSHFRYKPRFL